MIIIEDDRIEYDMSYPVGKNMENLLENTKVFTELIMEHAPKDQQLNFLCRGSSGAIIAGIVASSLPKEYKVIINHIKKKGETSHDNGLRLNMEDFNIIIDDFIASGRTVNSIYEAFLEAGGANIDMLIVSGNVYTTQELEFAGDLQYLVCGRACPVFKEEYES